MEDGDKKFLALTASGIAALLIVLTVAAQAEMGRSAQTILDVRAPAAAGHSKRAKLHFTCRPSTHACSLP
jgi:hypothetical protein